MKDDHAPATWTFIELCRALCRPDLVDLAVWEWRRRFPITVAMLDHMRTL